MNRSELREPCPVAARSFSGIAEGAMTLPPERIRLPEAFASPGDPVDGNPFPIGSAAHKVWSNATRSAEEEVCRINAVAGSTLTHENAPAWLPTLAVAKFNVWARRGVHVVWFDAAMQQYDRWLHSYANAWLDGVMQFYARDPPPFPVDEILIDLRNQLGGQVNFWMAEARRYRAEQELHRAALRPVKAQSDAKKVGGPKLAVWLTVEMEKRDHMTCNGLHVQTALDRKTIRAMLDGKLVARVRLAKLASGLGVLLSDIPTD